MCALFWSALLFATKRGPFLVPSELQRNVRDTNLRPSVITSNVVKISRMENKNLHSFDSVWARFMLHRLFL